MFVRSSCLALSSIVLAAAAHAAPAAPPPSYVDQGKDGKLMYDVDAKGNRIPDFSYAGYKGGGVPLPSVPAKVLVTPVPGDDRARIQAALKYVAGLPTDDNGIRGAVQLGPGRYEVAGHLELNASGVVLRGVGNGANGTTIVATGNGRRTLLEIRGLANRQEGTARQVTSAYVPVNATTLELDSTEGLKTGDAVLVRRPSPKDWVIATGQGEVPERPAVGWKAGTLDVIWDRQITAVNGNQITVDAPLTCALEKEFGGGKVTPYTWPGRINNVGIENLRLESEWDKANPKDEEHSWTAVTLSNVEDAWLRDITAAHFVSSLANVLESARRVTVQDCASVAPIGEIGGYRRHTFYTAGGQTLFLRCSAEDGRHDFATGWMAPGPNAFVFCKAQNAHDFSGPIESWATGVLLDNVNMDGGGLRLDNRELWDNGVGWAGANSLIWQSSSPVIIARTPPGAANWVIGSWAQFAGNASWRSPNEFVNPDSIYQAQLKERVGNDVAFSEKRPILTNFGGTPIETVLQQHPQLTAVPPKPALRKLALQNGWLTVDGKVLSGGQRGIAWWRGSTNPQREADFGESITRFVPGRVGPSQTDDLDVLTTNMAAKNAVAIRHHWGLWYERRRDDHEMIRRADADVWPPFFEQPWARSGQGRSWNGLSKYDLSKFNPWYFGRLQEFARHADQKGLVLVNEMYFQHNILEAGAHWAEFPWRSANNINDVGFPEPPPYAGGKRIFMADMFYDVKHPVRTKLHQLYIRHSLDNLVGQSNVLHVIGDEYTGPTHFMQFWVDEVGKWRRDTRKHALIGLSAPKNVQDAILADPKRAEQIDTIDFKYWWQTSKGLFAPEGGKNMAPRQEERQWKGGRPTDLDLARMTAEYKGRFPGKAIICDFDSAGWAFLCAGGSLARLPATTDAKLLTSIPRMQPWKAGTTNDQWVLRETGQGFLIHSASGSEAELDLSGDAATYTVHIVDGKTGAAQPTGEKVAGGGKVSLKKPSTGGVTFWLTRN